MNKFLVVAGFALAALGTSALAQDADPPSRVARLNYVNGNVSMEPAGVDDWAPAIVNRPFSIGDYLYTDQKSVAELHTDIGALRMGEYTSFGVLNITDNLIQLKLTEGDMQFRIRRLQPDDAFEVDTPNAAINLLRDGEYHIHVDPQGNTTYVAVRSGQAEVTGGGQAFTINPGDGANLSGTDQLSYNVEQAPAPDALDQWAEQRDTREDHPRSAQYLPPSVVGSEDLDEAGDWTNAPEYGAVWYPRSVPVDWAPYHYGHWAWVEPWGWTWVDDAPWGFAPFHYGRWVYWHSRWGWAPGPIAVAHGGYGGYPVVRPVYAPALVAWFGGAHFGVSISFGRGPALGWVPLGWGEVYTPSYHCGQNYFRNVNVNNTRITNVTNITNVYKTVYVNKTVYNQTFVNAAAPHAVAAMPTNAFAQGAAVHQSSVAVTPAQFRSAAANSIIAPGVAPTRNAVSPSLGRPAPRPTPAAMDRQVVARSTPPPAPTAFAARQAYLSQHAGEVHDFAAMHAAVAPQARPAVALVRQAPAAPRPFVAPAGSHAGAPIPQPAASRQFGNPQAQRDGAARVPMTAGAAAPPSQQAQPPVNTPAQRGVPPNLRQQQTYGTLQRGDAANPRTPPAAATAPVAPTPGRNVAPDVRNGNAVRPEAYPAQTAQQPQQHGAPPPDVRYGNAAPRQAYPSQAAPPAERIPTQQPQQHGAPPPDVRYGNAAPRQAYPSQAAPPAERIPTQQPQQHGAPPPDVRYGNAAPREAYPPQTARPAPQNEAPPQVRYGNTAPSHAQPPSQAAAPERVYAPPREQQPAPRTEAAPRSERPAPPPAPAQQPHAAEQHAQHGEPPHNNGGSHEAAHESHSKDDSHSH